MTFNPIESLFLSEEFSDVTFIVDNKSISAHKTILAANCPYFKTMLFGATKESTMEAIKLENVSYNIFVEVLRCAYLGKVIISAWTPGEVMKLIQIADEYQFAQLACAIAESIDLDTQIKDILQGVFEVAKKLNWVSLMNKCAEFARKRKQQLLENKEAFDELSMDFIVYVIDNGIWHSTDARLVYSIGNWRKTASIEDKKVLLSKIDWKSFPGKYSEPLVRMFLKDDVNGLQVTGWTDGLEISNKVINEIVAIYLSHETQFYNQSISDRLQDLCVIDKKSQVAFAFIYFREQVTNVSKIMFTYDGEATISLNLYGDNGETSINGTSTDLGARFKWVFEVPPNVNFLSIVLQIVNKEFENEEVDDPADHYIENLEFCCD